MSTKSAWLTRSAGVLLPVSALPSKYGIGTFGRAAYKWVDFLADAGQKYWQVLPLGPTGFGNSPYQSFSAFAGNPLFVDLAELSDEGLIKKSALKKLNWGDDPARVDYDLVKKNRETVLRQAFKNFDHPKKLARFRSANKDWVEDYALFVSVKARMGDQPWTQWEEDIRLRRPQALAQWRETCKKDMEYHIFVQYLFFEQWKALKKYAAKKGVQIIGDAPIYVSMDSADVWAAPELFQLDENNVPIEVAGCPPDAFSEDGQLWGNPLYRWDVMAKDGFSWWIKRLKANLKLVDVLRIDHFRGFESYYAIPYGEPTARNGRWVKGPGRAFIKAVKENLTGAPIIAEDLGYLTPAVHSLLKFSGFPGMKVLQFAFDSEGESDYMPHTYERNCIVYTGTHDNTTTLNWLETADKKAAAKAKLYAGAEDDKAALWGLIRLALSSVSSLAVIPMQDYLEQGASARMNTPSTVGDFNWAWRMTKDQPTAELAQKMAELSVLFGRCAPKPKRGRKKKA